MRLQIKCETVDITDDVLLEGTTITQEFGGRISTMGFSIVDLASNPAPVAHWDLIEVYDWPFGNRQFTGYVTVIETAPFRGGTAPMVRYNVTVSDYMLLLDRTIVPSIDESASADNTVIVSLFSTYLSAISTSGVSNVGNFSLTRKNMSLRKIMEEIAAQTQAHFYVTPDAVLHYHAAGASAAPFDLSEDPDMTSGGSYPFELKALRYVEDFTNPVNRCTVLGSVESGTEISQTYNDATSQSNYGLRAKVITDRSVASAAEALALATAEVAQYKDPRAEGSITFWKDGLSVGDLLTIDAPTFGCDGSFRVSRLRMEWKKSRDTTTYTAEFGIFRPDLYRALRKLNEIAQQAAETPVAVPADGSVGDSKLDRTTDPVSITNADIHDLNAGKIDAGYISVNRLSTLVAYIRGSAMISNAVITNAHINDLSADKINAGHLAVSYIDSWGGATISITSDLTFSGGADLYIASPGGLFASFVDAGSFVADSSVQCASVSTATVSASTSVSVGGNLAISATRTFYGTEFSGTSVDVSGDVDFGDELKRNGSVIVNTSSCFVGAGGVDVSAAVDGTSFKVSGLDVIGANGDHLIRHFTQAARPTLTTDEIAFWYDSDEGGGTAYILIKDSTNYFKVAMTSA